MQKTWCDLSGDRFEEDLASLVDALSILDIEPTRFLRSQSGRRAFLLRFKAINDSPAIDIQLNHSLDFKNLALLLPWHESDAEHDEIAELLKCADVVAVPKSLASSVKGSFEQCGKLRIKSVEALDFTLMQPKPIKADTLLKGAPQETEKPKDALDGRRDWFKSRHSTSD